MGIFDTFRKKTAGRPTPPKTDTTDQKSDTVAVAPKEKSDKESGEVTMTRGPLAKNDPHEASQILLRPLFTEKNDRLKALGQYTFIVRRYATKVDVARAIKDLYGVKPVSVRMLTVHGKQVHFGRHMGREKDEKKAIVTLASGQTLTVIGK